MNTHCCDYDAGQAEIQIPQDSRLVKLLKTSITKLFTRLSAWYQLKKQRRLDRDSFRNMLALDDATLKDIGVKKSDVIWASQLPLSLNASLELEKKARQPGRSEPFNLL